jgi:alpha-beta hydrolase superfamily lysophospholipase
VGATAALDELVALLRARDDAEAGVAAEMRSAVYPGSPGSGSVILLHGLTASPPAWRAVAEALAALGRTVIVPRLMLHGHADRMTTVLRGIRAQDLIDDVAAIVGAVAELGEPITIAGHSLGATLALDAATRGPASTRVVAVAPFLGIAGVPHEVHPFLLRAMALVPNHFLWWNPALRERLEPKHGYPRYPLAALHAGLEIADRARDDARRAPVARAIDIVINDAETSVNNRTAQRLADEWRGAGASIAVHRLRGLNWSHDIIEPVRPEAQRAFATLIDILESDHRPADREHRIG